MINAAPLGVCNIVTDVSVTNVVTNIKDHGNQLYINSEIEQEKTGKSLDELFKINLNYLLRNKIDKEEHDSYKYTHHDQSEEYRLFGQYFTSRYRNIRKIMQGEEFENKSFSFDLKEKEGKEKMDMAITLFTIDDNTVESQIYRRCPAEQLVSGTKTTLEKILLKCEEMNLDDVIVLDLTCSVVDPQIKGRDLRSERSTFNASTRRRIKTKITNNKNRRECVLKNNVRILNILNNKSQYCVVVKVFKRIAYGFIIYFLLLRFED